MAQVEGAGRTATFRVYLTDPVEKPVTLTYATQDGTAEAGKDYTSAEGTLTFAPGETAKQITVQLLGDTDAKEAAEETFFLTLKPQDGVGVANSYVIPEGKAAAAARVIEAGKVDEQAKARIADLAKAAGEAPEAGSKYVTDYIHEFHFLGAVFALLIVLMLVIGAVRPLKTPWVQEDVGAVDMTPWKHKGKAGLVLVLIVLAIYAVFADSSVLQ